MLQTVIFDLDGTLLDTVEDLADSLNATLSSFGFPTRPTEWVRATVGNGLANLVRRAVPETASDETCALLLAEFKRYYASHAEIKTKPYAGIPALLRELNERGIRVGVVSNKMDAITKPLCAHLLGGLTDAVLGETPMYPRKPDPASTLALMNLLGGTAETTVYVGDSEVDILTANHAGLRYICVTWGFRTSETLVAAGAKQLADSVAELRDLLF